MMDDQIAYITINPAGRFLQSLKRGFAEVGLAPAYLIRVSPRQRLLQEWRKHRLGIMRQVLLPKLKENRGMRVSEADESMTSPSKVVNVARLNSTKTRGLLMDLGIKYLINAGAGIFGSQILTVPGLCVVNAHAGWLPKYRNMNVVEWAIYNGDPVIGTVHLIDRGIDTGPILMEGELDVSSARSLDEVREVAFEQVARLVGLAVVGLAKGEVIPYPQSHEGAKSWYVMHPYFRARTEEKLRPEVARKGQTSDGSN